MAYDYDIVVIGGGPAGYAAAIRAAQLKKRVLCVERDKLGGICLNWGCIPTKALLTNAHLVDLIKNHGKTFGYSGEATWDFSQMIARSRGVASKLNKGIEGLFRKYKVASKLGTAKVIAPNTVQVGDEKITAESIVVSTGVRPRPLPGAEFDGKTILSYKEAMSLPKQPKSMLIIGAGPIGLEFGYFYNAIGTQVTVVELLDRILPGEDEEVSQGLRESLTKRGLTIHTSSKTGKVEKTANGVKVEVETPKGKQVIEAETMLVSIGVLGNVENLFADSLKVELFKNHIKVDPKNGYQTNVKGIYAVGDIIGPPWLAHVAHHEAICCIERLCGHADHTVDYTNVPGCTYTDPGVASVGLTEKAAREAGHEVRVGRFPFFASGRAVASDETEGFVKLIFDAKYGELLGAHLLGSQATELIAELVMAKKLEATEEEIIQAMHPHPTYSEAVMEAAAQGLGASVHI
ncbi:dihydrolipoamide dehydrogenase [Singulisphaera sp. GP187]|uniref:dihydrolipoyl dehydrogenase n=1 Tax=Singulisphaera sp. GP187 TaxID=1882752 RepID=UPI0009299DA8|nr:dihydrolipoyl dehydrogenase [Singulisphaera sp. GP187]SIO13938.1 dihydrolipoamide dehydrogenase [Singulisphaera sp. GP187]